MKCENDFEIKLKFIAAHYGLRHQLLKTLEELSELSEAIVRHIEKPTQETKAHIVEEWGDVLNMGKQVLSLMDVSETEVIGKAIEKVNRQMGRIEEEEKCKKDDSPDSTLLNGSRTKE